MKRTAETMAFSIIFILAISVCALAWPIPDSGQTKCYNDSEEIPCPASGEDFYGQDASYIINPRLYTKVDAQGNDLPDDAAEWVMVRDNVTGLIWEVKQAKDDVVDYSNPHDADNTYTWYDSNLETNGGYPGTPEDVTDTEDFVNALNAEKFGGFSDWRLPSINELTSVTNLENLDPATDTTYFPRANSSDYWSASTYAYYTNYAWSLYFQVGNGANYPKLNSRYVRAVRSGESRVSDNLVVNGDGTVTDTETGLMWQQGNDAGQTTWKESLAYCESLSFAGYDNWRMPSRDELLSIADYESCAPAINTNSFPDTNSSNYWSATTDAYNTDTAWCVNFYYGNDNNDNKSGNRYVLAVRSGDPQLSGHLVVSSPRQGSYASIGDLMPIRWETQDITGNVSISISREGGKEDTFETIAETTENDGTYDWTITGPVSGNCMLKIESLSDPSKGTTQGLFSLDPQYIITATSRNNGIINPAGEIGAKNGQDSAFLMTPAPGYQVADVLVGGVSVGAVTDYTFTNITGNHSIHVIFETSGTYTRGNPIPDSGLTKCYNQSSEITCPQPGEDFYGQDGNHIMNPRSYTKLDAQGNNLPDEAEEWVMVRDNVFGLIWEVKQSKDNFKVYSNPHDADNTYTWYDSNPETNRGNAGTLGTGTDTEDFIKALNDENFGGFSDWRLPTIKELASLTNLGYLDPAIDRDFFPGTDSSYYWSATTYASSRSYAWRMDFSTGIDNYSGKKSGSLYVRAVRSGESPISDNLVINGDGTVTDTETGLMWQQGNVSENMNWKDSLAYCENLSFAGYDDWRMPTREELRSIAYYGNSGPAIKPYYFPATNSSYYWSATTYVKSTGSVWHVNFTNGDAVLGGKTTSSYHVRAVRSGEPRLSGNLVISSPNQGSYSNIASLMSIQWETQDITGNVSISISREGGKEGTYETIAETTENDGAYDWRVTGPVSVNCMMKIEPLNDPSKGVVLGLFSVDPEYTITTTSRNNGTITPSGEVAAENGQDKAFLMTPAPGYQVADVLVGGVSVGAVTDYTFTNITGNHSIHVIFETSGHTLGKPIPDSGQTQCYDDQGNGITCPRSGEDFYGQDANYTINPRSYTKLDHQGNNLPDQVEEWAMVRDNVTGLTWEVKQADDNIQNNSNPHDADNRYFWYDSNPETNGGYAGTDRDGTDTEDFIKALNDENFGGFSDWRLPTIKELASLTNLGNFNPATDRDYFPGTDSSYYWSSTTYASSNRRYAWCMDFSNGSSNNYDSRNRINYVRAVRSGHSRVSDNLVINGDGTVTDTETGLMWQGNDSEEMNWKESLAYCENLSIAGYDDWRMPSREELRSVVDYEKSGPAISTNFFPDTNPSRYWSATAYASNTSYAWCVLFSNGDDSNYRKSGSLNVRAVRSGESRLSGHLVISRPSQGSYLSIGSLTPIQWETQDITGNVSISISREGGKDGTYEIIAETTENDGTYDWTVTGPASVNCMLKTEPLNDPSKRTTRGLFSINASQSIQHTITATSEPHGAIYPTAEVIVNKGASETFTIYPADGYEISDVLADGSSVGPVSTHTFTEVNADHAIHASFKEKETVQHTITATSGNNGTISPEGDIAADAGESKTFTMNPVEGYEVEDVVADGKSIGSKTAHTFTEINADHTIHVTFKTTGETRYTILATAGDHGSIDPVGDIVVDENASKTFAIQPDEEYEAHEILTDGEPTELTSTYTFQSVTSDHTIHASFVKIENPLSVSITSPQDGLPMKPVYNIQGTASDKSGQVAKVELQITSQAGNETYYLDADNKFDLTHEWLTANGTNSWSFNTSGVTWSEDTPYQISAQATNSSEETSTHSITFVYGEQAQPSTITCDLSVDTLVIGESIHISGQILPDPGQIGAGVDVTLISPEPEGEEFSISVLANKKGEFSYDSVCGQINREGTWTVRSTWGGNDDLDEAVSEDQNFQVSRAKSNLTLDLSSQAIKDKEKVSLSGRILPQPDCGKILPGVELKLKITDPDGTGYEESLTPDNWGFFRLQYYNGFNKLGDWTVQAVFEGNEAYTETESEILLVSVLKTAGYGIIIQGKNSAEEGIRSHNKTTNFVYKTLKQRGLTDDDIRYFNYDTSQPGVDAIPLKAEIQKAITEWAKDKMNPETGKPAHLYIVMVDHGLEERFYIDSEQITPGDIDGWLDTLQGSLTGQAGDQKIILILGFCFSGSFIEKLAGENRVIITSAGPNEFSYKGPLEPGNIREGEYFVSEFFKKISYGKSVRDSFREAVRLTERFTSSYSEYSGNFSGPPYFDNAPQHPLLEDDGKEPFGVNNLSESDSDGLVSRELFIGVSSVTANAPGDVMIQEVNDSQFLEPGDNSVNLWAVVDNFDRVSTLWCEVKPPNYMPPDPGDAGSSEQAEIDIFRTFYSETSENLFQWINLGENPDDPDFSTPGTYQIFFFAKDFYSGNISPLMETRIYKAEPENSPPDPFSLVRPLNAAEDETITVSTSPILEWEDASDPEGNNLSYTVLISQDDPFFKDPIYKDGLRYSTCLVLSSDGLTDGGVYYWKVLAIDEYGAVRESEASVFRTDNYHNPLDGWIHGRVYDRSANKPVDTFDIVVGDETLETVSQGYYIGEKSPGKYNVMIKADGYESASSEVKIIEEEIVTRNFVLEPLEPVCSTADPTFSPVSGQYDTPVDVEISYDTEDAVIHYTTDESTPTEDSDVFTSSVSVSDPATIKAMAFKTGCTASNIIASAYTFKVADPVFSPEPGAYAETQDVTISCLTPDATLYYTTDGQTAPTEDSEIYTSSLPISDSTTIKAAAHRDGWIPSETVGAEYEITICNVADPTFSPVSGQYDATVDVEISCDTEDSVIHYTTDESTPTEDSDVFASSVSVSDPATIKARAFKTGCTASNIVSSAYTFKVAEPVFAPKPGIYAVIQDITISCATPDATVYYTTDSQIALTEDSEIYISPLPVSVSTTLSARAYKENWIPSRITEAVYEITAIGDISGDDKIDLADAILILQVLTDADITSTVNLNADTDGDDKIGLPDAIYILQKLIAKTEYEIIIGDINGNDEIDLADAVLVLQVLTGTEITSAINIKAETDGDNEIGLAEVIYIMQKLSEFGR